MKRILLIVLLLIILFSCTACSDYYPRIVLQPTIWNIDNTYIDLRPDYQFMEDPFSIKETENGYDIIIHCIKIQ